LGGGGGGGGWVVGGGGRGRDCRPCLGPTWKCISKPKPLVEPLMGEKLLLDRLDPTRTGSINDQVYPKSHLNVDAVK